MVHNSCHWEISDSWVDGYAAIKLGRTILLSQFLLNNENFGCRSTLLYFLVSLSLSSSSLTALTAEKLNFKVLTGWRTMHSTCQDTQQYTCTHISTIALTLNMKKGPIIYLLYQLHCNLVGCLNILQNNTIQNNWHLWTIQAADKAFLFILSTSLYFGGLSLIYCKTVWYKTTGTSGQSWQQT